MCKFRGDLTPVPPSTSPSTSGEVLQPGKTAPSAFPKPREPTPSIPNPTTPLTASGGPEPTRASSARGHDLCPEAPTRARPTRVLPGREGKEGRARRRGAAPGAIWFFGRGPPPPPGDPPHPPAGLPRRIPTSPPGPHGHGTAPGPTGRPRWAGRGGGAPRGLPASLPLSLHPSLHPPSAAHPVAGGGRALPAQRQPAPQQRRQLPQLLPQLHGRRRRRRVGGSPAGAPPAAGRLRSLTRRRRRHPHGAPSHAASRPGSRRAAPLRLPPAHRAERSGAERGAPRPPHASAPPAGRQSPGRSWGSRRPPSTFPAPAPRRGSGGDKVQVMGRRRRRSGREEAESPVNSFALRSGAGWGPAGVGGGLRGAGGCPHVLPGDPRWPSLRLCSVPGGGWLAVLQVIPGRAEEGAFGARSRSRSLLVQGGGRRREPRALNCWRCVSPLPEPSQWCRCRSLAARLFLSVSFRALGVRWGSACTRLLPPSYKKR